MEQIFAQILTFFESHPAAKTTGLSLGLIAFILIVRKILVRGIDKKDLSIQDKILLKRKLTQYSFYFLIICIFMLWFAQLQVFLVSILAVAAAIVLALKELIMCITGGVLINSSNLFKVGQRIEIDGFRGFVIDKTLLTTKVLEIGPEKNSQQTTGDIIAIPNSLMLSKSLKNESYFKGYSIKSFVFKVSDENKILNFEKELLAIGESLTKDYIHDAKESISRFCEKEGLVVPSINPRTKILVEDSKDFSVLLKLPLKNTEIADIDQTLNRFYLDWRIKNKLSSKEES